jgi:hypothetical protein
MGIKDFAIAPTPENDECCDLDLLDCHRVPFLWSMDIASLGPRCSLV